MVDEALGFVDITCSELARLREWTPAQFQNHVALVLEERRRRARGEISQGHLKNVIKAAGFAPTDEGLLADPDLLMGGALLRRWQYDWMHCAFQAGFMSEAMWLVFKNIAILKFGSIGAGGDSMIGYLRQCQFPQCRRSVGRGLHHLFAPEMLKKHKSHRYIVANASVQFTLYAVVRAWATMEAEDDAQKEHLLVYLAVSRIIDIIRRVKHRQLSTACAKPMLLSGIAAWLELHKAKYGKAHIKPKYAWMWLFSKRLEDCEWLFDMFYVERQHQRIRAQAELVKNTSTFESSVLFRVVDAQCESLRKSNPLEDSYQLVGRRVPVAGAIVGFLADACVSGGNANTHEY